MPATAAIDASVVAPFGVEQDHDRRGLARVELRLERDPRVAARDAGRDRPSRRECPAAGAGTASRARSRKASDRHEHRDRAAHHAVRDLLPAGPARLAGGPSRRSPSRREQARDRQRVDPRPEHAQDRRQERQAVQHGREDDDRAAEADRASARSRWNQSSPDSPIATATPGEQHGLAGRAHGALHRLLDGPAAAPAPRGSGW